MKPISKTLQRSNDYYIQFTDEEMEALDIKPGDKYSCKIQNGGLSLEKYQPVEINISEFDREVLEFLVETSIQEQITVEEVIENTLKEAIKHFDSENG